MKVEMDEKTTYEVRLQCRTCNKDWIENVKKGIYIRSEKDNNYMVNPGDPERKHKLFKCPKCGAQKRIARLSIN